MNSRSPLLRAGRLIALPFALLSEWAGSRFYLALAVIVIGAALYGVAGGETGGMRHQAYDFIMKNRFRVPPPDPDIVLIDIDEPSLEAMAPEFGRWPWPRSVIAELTEGIARQQPAAIVYDIVFSDLDVNHPDADRYFRDVVARHPQTYFAMIRLNPENDPLSELKLAQLPGVLPTPAAQPEATVAMVVPYFFNILNDRRLGIINLKADDDGVARRYHVYREAHGWRIYSLPANVVAALGGELPERKEVLLNWRGPPLVYPTVSFHAAYRDLLRERPERAPDEFKGKIVVIGSTAPSLFDISPTSVAREHPGVEIMMTAIDNFKNGDFLTELPRGFYLLITVVAIVLLAMAFVYNVDPIALNVLFTIMQTGFLVVTYLFINFTTWFVDLTAPFAAVLAYFFIARLYNRAFVMRRNGDPLFSTTLDVGRECQVLLLSCRLAEPRAARRVNSMLQQLAGRTRYGASAPRLFTGSPLVFDIYQDTLLFYWLVPPERTESALRDLSDMLVRAFAGLRRRGLEAAAGWSLHAVRFVVDGEGRWRSVGKDAFVTAMTVVQGAAAGELHRSDSFLTLQASHRGIEIPTAVARTG